MFCIQSINDETNFYPHESVQLVKNDNGQMVEQVFYSKTRQPREQVEYEAGFDEYNPSLKEESFALYKYTSIYISYQFE